ncbi:MAG: hypothetical protein Q7T05_03415, partial [Dehalococcoidia bacterium]|nr:hypothetical protein [Dehalococcoidia bacterium]
MAFADVAVNSPAAQRSIFTYSVPAQLSLQIGHAVWVPFGPRTIHGVVVRVAETSAVAETRDILSLVAAEPLLSGAQVELALWMSEYYLSPVFNCLSLMLPPGMPRNPIVSFAAGPNDAAGVTLNAEELALLELVRRQGRASLRELSKLVGKANASRLASGLVKKGLLSRRQEFEPPQVKRKVVRFYHLSGGAECAGAEAATMAKVRSQKQTAVLDLIASAGPQPMADIRRITGASQSTVGSLTRNGLLRAEDRHVVRDPLSHRSYPVSVPPTLTACQASAWSELEGHLKSGQDSRGFLLHGVTGSGKT